MNATQHSVRPSPRRRRVIGGLLAVLLLAVAVCFAVTASGSNETANIAPPGEGGSVASSPDSADYTAFGVLRRPQTAADAVPAADDVSFSGASGANIALARHVAVTANSGAWVVPGNGSVCLVAAFASQPVGGAECSDDASAAAGKTLGYSGGRAAPGLILVSGLVPDGVSQVTVHLVDGSSNAVTVHENIYLDEATGDVSSVTFTGPNGPVSLEGFAPPKGVKIG